MTHPYLGIYPQGQTYHRDTYLLAQAYRSAVHCSPAMETAPVAGTR